MNEDFVPMHAGVKDGMLFISGYVRKDIAFEVPEEGDTCILCAHKLTFKDTFRGDTKAYRAALKAKVGEE